MKKRIIVALYLSKMNRSQKVTQGTATHNAVENGSYFPSGAEKTARLAALKDATAALAASDAATASGSHESYAQAETAELQFDTELRNMSYYVQTIAEADPVNAEEIILSAALKIKKSSSKMKPPMPVDDVSVKVTGLGDAVKMHIFSENPRSTHFEIQITTTPTDANSWDSIADITARKYLVTGLMNGVRYYFRVRAINSMGRSIYSDIVSQIAA